MNNEAMFNGLPAPRTKDNMFSVRMDDQLHKKLLAVTQREGLYRAVTTVELVKLGLKVYSEQTGMSLRESDIDQFLIEHKLIEPDFTNNNK